MRVSPGCQDYFLSLSSWSCWSFQSYLLLLLSLFICFTVGVLKKNVTLLTKLVKICFLYSIFSCLWSFLIKNTKHNKKPPFAQWTCTFPVTCISQKLHNCGHIRDKRNKISLQINLVRNTLTVSLLSMLVFLWNILFTQIIFIYSIIEQ